MDVEDTTPPEDWATATGPSPAWIIVTVVLGSFIALTAYLYISYYRQRGTFATAPRKKLGAKKMKREKLKQGMTVLGD